MDKIKFTFLYWIEAEKSISRTNVHAHSLQEAIRLFENKGKKFKRTNILKVKKTIYEYVDTHTLRASIEDLG